MAKHVMVEVRDGALVPADPWSAETIDGLDRTKTYRLDLKTDRKHGTSNHWWAGLAYMVERFEEYSPDDLAKKFPSSRKLHEAILIYLGYYETIHQLRGGVLLRPDSVRFEAMQEDEFKGLFEKARVMALDMWGIDPWFAWSEAKERAKSMGVDWRINDPSRM